jgi:hypothetical protein
VFLRNFFMNGVINTLTISYINYAIYGLNYVNMNIEEKGETFEFIGTFTGVALVLILYPTFLYYWLWKNSHKLDDDEYFAMTWGNLYKEINLDRSYWSMFYYPSWAFRRLFFVWTPLMAWNMHGI